MWWLLGAGALALVLLSGGTAGGASGGGPRTYTLADAEKLRQLLWSKQGLGRELGICLQKQTEHSLFDTATTIGAVVGLFTGLATLDVNAGLKAARAASEAYTKAAGSGDLPCSKELALTQQQLRDHDQLCKELGLPKDITYDQVKAILAAIPGVTKYFADQKASDTRDAWDRCVRNSGLTFCTKAWSTPGHTPIPPHDPKTGLAIR